ncbi:MAG: diguanylate cyclase [Phycisphaerae bacterium]|jgi:diguanylate cyclase (GGDEF)-like protein
MSSPERTLQFGLGLAGAGCVLLLLGDLLAFANPPASGGHGPLGPVASYATIVLGLLTAAAAGTQMRAPAARSVASGRPERRGGDGPAFRRILDAFHSWELENPPAERSWASFDRFVRERLLEHAGATQVRCFEVSEDGSQVRGLSAGERAGFGAQAPAAPAEEELLRVAASGRPRLDRTALTAEDGSWQIIWPVCAGTRCLGLIAVGRWGEPNPSDPSDAEAVLSLLGWCWKHARSETLFEQACRTDSASGMLTRQEFFGRAQQALERANAEHEPVVMLAIALEGVRRLDDAGRWRQRDALVEALGRALLERVRDEDVLGRFTDDRFVLLLRRLDAGLGRMVARKLLAACENVLARHLTDVRDIGVRIGLAGGDTRPVPLEALMVESFAMVQQARASGRRLSDGAPRAAGARDGRESGA